MYAIDLRRQIETLGLVAFCLLAGGSAAGADNVSLSDIPNVTFEYYTVSGRTLADIARSLERSRPTDPNDGQKVTALTNWAMGYSWSEDDRGGCDLSHATLRFQATITFPRHIAESNLPADVRERWRAFSEALLRHETNHVRYAWIHRGDVLRAVQASSCSRAAADGNRAIGAIVEHDLEYDRVTRHGETEGAIFP